MKCFLSILRLRRKSLEGRTQLLLVLMMIAVGSASLKADELSVMTAEEITAEAEYMLHKQLYVILTEVVPGRENEIMGALGEKHMEFQVGLEKNGILFAAGPLMNQDEKTYGGGGLIIIRAENLAQANDIAASDPLHAAGVRTYSIQPWLMNEGGFSISVSFSDMKYTLD